MATVSQDLATYLDAPGGVKQVLLSVSPTGKQAVRTALLSEQQNYPDVLFNVLRIGNAISLKASKDVIQRIVARPDVIGAIPDEPEDVINI